MRLKGRKKKEASKIIFNNMYIFVIVTLQVLERNN